MQFLYEESDNKETTTLFLMKLDCLCLCERVLYVCKCTDQTYTFLSYLHI